jgi:hypothetical protein
VSDQETLSASAIKALEQWPLFDNAIVRHGFAPYMRDYELIVETAAATPDGSRSYPEGRYRYVFTHCVRAEVETTVRDDVWRESWNDSFIDYAAWEARGCPPGYVWGVQCMDAYPGAKIVIGSAAAAEWADRLAKPMTEVIIETNAHAIRIVFHALRVYKVAEGDPATNELTVIQPRDLLAAT